MGLFIDLAGQRFGRLVALRRAENKGKKVVWSCACDCGRECLAHGHDLRLGKHKSCGCLQMQSVSKHNHTKFGGFYTREYRTWLGMKQRCLNPKATGYQHYGGRGIQVCERWMDFRNFLADMGARPDNLSLDRMNNDGNYEPGNCRWATRKEQKQNQRKSKSALP